MMSQFTSFDAFVSYFGASLFFLGLLSCLLPGFFRLGVIIMLIADIPLVLTILFPSLLHKLTDALEISELFADHSAFAWGLIVGIVTFIALFSLYYWLFKRKKHHPAKEVEQQQAAEIDISTSADLGDTNAKKARNSKGSLRTRHSLMLSEEDRSLDNDKLATLTEGMRPLDSNFRLGGYAQANKNLSNISDDSYGTPSQEFQSSLDQNDLSLSGLSAASESETDTRTLVMPEASITNPRAVGRVSDLLNAIQNGDLSNSAVVKNPVKNEPQYSFADMLSSAQDEQSGESIQDYDATNDQTLVALSGAADMSGTENDHVDVNLVHQETDHDQEQALQEKPLAETSPDEISTPASISKLDQVHAAEVLASDTNPDSAADIESVQAALSKLEAVAPTLDNNQAAAVAAQDSAADAENLAPAGAAEDLEEDPQTDRIGLSFTVSTSNKDGPDLPEPVGFVDRSSYTGQTKYTASFHENELNDLVHDDLGSGFTDKKTKGVDVYQPSVQVSMAQQDGDMPTQGNDLIQSLQTHSSSGDAATESQNKSLNMGNVNVAQALARLSSEAQAIAAAIDQAAVSHGIERPKTEVAPIAGAAAPQKTVATDPLLSYQSLATKKPEFGTLSLNPQETLSLVSLAPEPQSALKIEPVVDPVQAQEQSQNSLLEPSYAPTELKPVPLSEFASDLQRFEQNTIIDKPISIASGEEEQAASPVSQPLATTATPAPEPAPEPKADPEVKKSIEIPSSQCYSFTVSRPHAVAIGTIETQQPAAEDVAPEAPAPEPVAAPVQSASVAETAPVVKTAPVAEAQPVAPQPAPRTDPSPVVPAPVVAEEPLAPLQPEPMPRLKPEDIAHFREEVERMRQQSEVEIPYFQPQESSTDIEPKMKAIRQALEFKQRREQTSAAIALEQQKQLEEAAAKYKAVQEALEQERKEQAERELREQVAREAEEALVLQAAKEAQAQQAAQAAAKRKLAQRIAQEQAAQQEAMRRAQEQQRRERLQAEKERAEKERAAREARIQAAQQEALRRAQEQQRLAQEQARAAQAAREAQIAKEAQEARRLAQAKAAAAQKIKDQKARALQQAQAAHQAQATAPQRAVAQRPAASAQAQVQRKAPVAPAPARQAKQPETMAHRATHSLKRKNAIRQEPNATPASQAQANPALKSLKTHRTSSTTDRVLPR